MNRKQSKAIYADRYTILNGERSDTNLFWICVYCGMPADTRDHAPPLSRVSDYESFNLEQEFYLLVPCCSSCNSILGDSLQETILQRIEHLKDRLSSRYAKRIKAQEWDDSEVLELGRNLRSWVAVSSAKDLKIKHRVEYYGGYDSIADQLLLDK